MARPSSTPGNEGCSCARDLTVVPDGCYIAAMPAPPDRLIQGGSAMRRLIVSSLLTIGTFVLTAATVLAGSTGPGV